ncbi:16S rRNA (uracil(1498)-N(3))-methyltransferase [Aliikangiella sp. IMCC44653]
MRTHRFYLNDELSLGLALKLPKEVSHHCIQVLRYKAGQTLCLFNGDGYEYTATIEKIEAKQAWVTITQAEQQLSESPLNLHLFQGIAKGDKMDLIIQKSVELGVKSITPVFSERCNVKLDHKRLEKKMLHWKKVLISACEQSGRAIIPALQPPLTLNSAASLPATGQTTIYLEPTADSSLSQIHKPKDAPHGINLFVGPEGGLSDSDIAILKSLGAVGVSLGPRILRTETAGFCCISILQSQFGDLN